MYQKYIDRYFFHFILLLFTLSYCFYWPQQWMITDSYSYSSQALAFAQGELHYFSFDFLSGKELQLNFPPYNLGTSSYFAIFIALFGKDGIFLGSLASIIASAILIYKSIKNSTSDIYAICIFFLSIPILFFSRSIMSCVPSLLVVSSFFYFFTKKSMGIPSFLILGFLAGISIWFRESNAILLIGFLGYAIYSNRKRFLAILIGGIVGVSIKLVSSYLVYGKMWFLSASAGFSLESIVSNSPVYLIIALFLIPLSLTAPLVYQGAADRILKSSFYGFLVLYLCYNYNAVEYSGWLKGSLLTSRFLIPAIPLVIIAFADFSSRKLYFHKFLKHLAFPLCIFLIPISQAYFHSQLSAHENASKALNKYQSEAILYDKSGYSNIIRYINPLVGDWSKTSDLTNLDSSALTKYSQENDVFIIISSSIENEQKSERTNKIKSMLDHVVYEKFDKIRIDDNNHLLIYKFLHYK